MITITICERSSHTEYGAVVEEEVNQLIPFTAPQHVVYSRAVTLQFEPLG